MLGSRRAEENIDKVSSQILCKIFFCFFIQDIVMQKNYPYHIL